MNIVTDINHPAQVHFFKNFIRIMEEEGHKILVTATRKDVNIQLLDDYGIKYANLGTYGKSIGEKLVKLPIIDYKMYKEIKNFKPDILCGVGSIRAAHVSKILNKPCINFDDTETQGEQHILYVPLTTVVFTPSFYLKNLGWNQIRYNSYHQLAYLHPDLFQPDPTTLENINIGKNEFYSVVRLVSFDATHDVGKKGITDKTSLIKKLEEKGRVFITSEGKTSQELEKYKITISPTKLHDLLAYASIYIGDGGTTASEAATLGTHSIFINSSASKLGLFHELQKYGVLNYFNNQKDSEDTINTLLETKNLKDETTKKRHRLIEDKFNVTKFLKNIVNNYPASIEELKGSQ